MLGSLLSKSSLAGETYDTVGKSLEQLKEQEAKLDRELWSKEVLASQYSERITKLWDDLIAQSHSLEPLKALEFSKLTLPTSGEPVPLKWEVSLDSFSGAAQTFSRAQFAALLDKLSAEGFKLQQSEWHHSEFDQQGDKATSVYHVVLHALNIPSDTRHIIDADLKIEWAAKPKNGVFVPEALTVTRVEKRTRQGQPPFDPPLPLLRSDNLARLGGASGEPHPLASYDYDLDGDTDVLVIGWNLLFRNNGQREFEPMRLLDKPAQNVTTSLIGDLTGDGIPDLLLGAVKQPLMLYQGLGAGKFLEEPSLIQLDNLRLPYAITAGDVDQDGDLDLWVGQYRKPYEFGTMPKPFYDANDGWPSYLLLNDGDGRFTDGTQAAGLGAKRNRRVYSASLVDLDNDGDMDLLNVADFAGVDLFLNDGKGRFKDVTAERLPEARLFGMGHAVADFNQDGALDFFVTGMGSTTARRIQKMGLFREDRPEHDRMRMPMAYGNRLYLSGARGAFEEPSFKDKVARTGWSWGTVAEDFDLDGMVDIYVGNGNASGKSTQDYCTQFWRHDVYVNTEEKSEDLGRLFLEHLRGVADGETSWNGYEHNAMLMNLGAQGFFNVGYLLGTGFEFDTRAVGADDHDGDGRVDLVLTSKGQVDEAVGVYLVRNTWPTENNWFGVVLREHTSGYSPFGAKVKVVVKGVTSVHQFVSGDSHQAQHSFSKVFGIGLAESVDSAEVVWPNGEVTKIPAPQINAYNSLNVPDRVTPAEKTAEIAKPLPKETEESTSMRWSLLLGAGLGALLLLLFMKNRRAKD